MNTKTVDVNIYCAFLNLQGEVFTVKKNETFLDFIQRQVSASEYTRSDEWALQSFSEWSRAVYNRIYDIGDICAFFKDGPPLKLNETFGKHADAISSNTPLYIDLGTITTSLSSILTF